MAPKRKLILFIAMSLDGFIAGPNDDLSFLSLVAMDSEDYGYFRFLNEVDTVIMGRRTYDWVMKQVNEFPHADKITYIITKNSKPDIGNTRFYNDNLEELIIDLKARNGRNIFCDGGAMIVNALLKKCLIDEFIISIIPVLLGQGIRLFNQEYPEQNLALIESKSFNSGLVQVHYRVKE